MFQKKITVIALILFGFMLFTSSFHSVAHVGHNVAQYHADNESQSDDVSEKCDLCAFAKQTSSFVSNLDSSKLSLEFDETFNQDSASVLRSYLLSTNYVRAPPYIS
jgi:hypothetical protein